MREPLTRASMLEGFEAFCQAREISFDHLLSAAGLTRDDLKDSDHQISLNAVANILDTASVASGDGSFGLHWAEAFPLGGTGVLGYLMLNAKSTRSAVRALTRFVSLHIEPIEVSFEEVEGLGHFIWRYPPTLTAPRTQYTSFAMALIIIRLRKYAGSNWHPIGIELEHRELPDRSEWQRVLGPNVKFDSPRNALHIRETVLNRSSDDVDLKLFALIRELGERMLADRKSATDIVQLTRKAIVDGLEEGEATLEDIAAAMNLAPRTLQGQLGNVGTNFDTLLHETRQNLAEVYLRDTDLPMTEIALLLGFSELSAFTRAANRWFGVAPRQYRTELRRPA